jgi:Protein of unknown function (DUF2892)
MKLTHNMGSIDRWVRGLIIGPSAIIAAVLTGAGSVLGIVLIAVGVIMLATAVVGMCPLYAMLGVYTHRGDHEALGA